VNRNANDRICQVSEEAIVDLLLHKETSRSAYLSKLRRHAEECEVCLARMREWMQLLADQRLPEMPSPSVWRRLRRSIIWRKHLALWKRLFDVHKRSITVFCASSLLAAGLYFGIFRNTEVRQSILEQPVMPAKDEQILQSMWLIIDSKTARYPIVPTQPGSPKGYAWVNVDANEMVLLVEGLPDDPDEDYRVWSVHSNNRVQLGSLNLSAGKAHLHYHGNEVAGAETISVSKERKGDEVSQPSADLMTIKLNKRMP
jgi:hypothetical protein